MFMRRVLDGRTGKTLASKSKRQKENRKGKGKGILSILY